MKITVLIDKAGNVVAAHVPIPVKVNSYETQPMSRLVPSDGQEMRELELADKDALAEPGPAFLENLRRLTAKR